LSQTPENWNDKLLGCLYPAVPTPFASDGTPDLAILNKYAFWMDMQPVDGVTVWTETGQGEHLDSNSRKSIISAWREVLDSDLQIIASIKPAASPDPATAISLAMQMISDTQGLADFHLVQPPSQSFPTNNGSLRNYYMEIAKSGVPTLLAPESQKNSSEFYSQPVLDQLLSIPEVAGIVINTPTVVDFQEATTHVRMRHPSKAILTGENRMLGYSFYRGCHGVLAGLTSICPALQRAMIDAWFMNEMTRFLELNRLVDHLAEAIFTEPCENHPERLLAGLAHLGIIDPVMPMKLSALSSAEGEFVRETLDALGEWALA
jgi:dihydrodipicolinate synthase/N-acetylneuraminate lyase